MVHDTVPLFPIDSYTPESKCPHHGPLKAGTLFCCMVCSQSGMDAHPALRRDPKTDPKPEPAPPSVPLTRESNKQRRKRERREAAAKRTPARAA